MKMVNRNNTMSKVRKYVSMDWAAKKLLRSKANYEILEGFLSELLREDIVILSIRESETNKTDVNDKFNRVDLLVEDSRKQQIIIEIQFEQEVDYFQRILYGVAKVLTENLHSGEPYGKVCKIISISIVYFDLGQGMDYIYHGQTSFTGIHQKDELTLSNYQKSVFQKNRVGEIFPEYYLLKINQFDDVAKDSLDEWIYFLKNEEIKGDFPAKGLSAAKEKLDYMKLNEADRRAYEEHRENQRYRASMVEYSIKRAEEEAKRADNHARRAEEEAHRAEEQARRAEEQARRADEQARRANEQARRANDEARRADEQARRADDEARRADEQARRADDVTKLAIQALLQAGLSEAEAKAKLGFLREENNNR